MITTQLHSLWQNVGRAALIAGASAVVFAQAGNAEPLKPPSVPPVVEATNVEATKPAAATAGAGKGVVWETNVLKFDEVFKPDADVNGQAAVLYFTADWCGYCRQMERTTLANGSVRDRMEKFKRVKLDFDVQPDLVRRYRIDGVPAFVMVNARGEEIARLVGMTEADPFRAWLETSEMQAAAQAAAILERRERLAGFAAVLDAKETGADAWKNLKPSLLAMAARGAPEERAFAQQRLLAKGTQAPAELFDGLANGDLSVRLNTAVMLRKIIGDEFNFDPWADAATRAAAVEKLNAAYGVKPVSALTGDAARAAERSYLDEQRKQISLVYKTRFVHFKDTPSPETVKMFSGVLTAEQTKAALALLAEMETRKEVKLNNGPTVEGVAPGRMTIGDSVFYPILWKPGATKDQWIPAEYETIDLIGCTVGIFSNLVSADTVEMDFDAAYIDLDGFLDDEKISVNAKGLAEQKVFVNQYGPLPLSRKSGRLNDEKRGLHSIMTTRSMGPIISSYSVKQNLRLRVGESAVIWGQTKPDAAAGWTLGELKSPEVKPWLVLVTVTLPQPRR